MKNQKGILLTASVFILVIAILFFNSTIQQKTLSFEQRTDWIALREAGNQYNEIQRELVQLDLSGNKKEILERGLPFTYDASSNSVSFTQNVPITTSALTSYFNMLNGYRIFLQQKASERLSQEFSLDINSAKDSSWGGTASSANLLVQPTCLAYSLSIQNASWKPGNSPQCDQAFDPVDLDRMDLNLLIVDVREDFDTLTCNDAACPQDPYNPSDPDPYFALTIDTSHCTDCALPQTTVSRHFSLGSNYLVKLSCGAEECDSETVSITVNNLLTVGRSSTKALQLESTFTFHETPEYLQVLDFNYSIQNAKYGIIRTNRFETVPQ